jgi:hypothetical protein
MYVARFASTTANRAGVLNLRDQSRKFQEAGLLAVGDLQRRRSFCSPLISNKFSIPPPPHHHQHHKCCGICWLVCWEGVTQCCNAMTTFISDSLTNQINSIITNQFNESRKSCEAAWLAVGDPQRRRWRRLRLCTFFQC